MLTLFAPLFRQFTAVERPIRYFLLLFITILGALHLVNDLALFFVSNEFMELPRLFMFSILMSIVVFISNYFRQKKQKQLAAQTIAA